MNLKLTEQEENIDAQDRIKNIIFLKTNHFLKKKNEKTRYIVSTFQSLWKKLKCFCQYKENKIDSMSLLLRLLYCTDANTSSHVLSIIN